MKKLIRFIIAWFRIPKGSYCYSGKCRWIDDAIFDDDDVRVDNEEVI